MVSGKPIDNQRRVSVHSEVYTENVRRKKEGEKRVKKDIG